MGAAMSSGVTRVGPEYLARQWGALPGYWCPAEVTLVGLPELARGWLESRGAACRVAQQALWCAEWVSWVRREGEPWQVEVAEHWAGLRWG